MTRSPLRPTENRRDWLLPILSLFTVTFFVYRDFDIRMLYGYALLALILGVHVLRRLWDDRAPALDPYFFSAVIQAEISLYSPIFALPQYQ